MKKSEITVITFKEDIITASEAEEEEMACGAIFLGMDPMIPPLT